MLIDTTLREGAQLFGATFSPEFQESIIEELLYIGIEEIELGWIGMHGLQEILSRIPKTSSSHCYSVWAPLRMDSLEKASDMGIQRLHMGFPVSDRHLEKRLCMEKDVLLEHLCTLLQKAQRLGLEVSVGLEDFSRAERDFAVKAAQIAEQEGAFRVRLADTVGVLTPTDWATHIKFFRHHIEIPLAVHCHNDFGMATANVLTALAAGAQFADVSLLGIGERAGIAALEEVTAFLVLQEKSTQYKLDTLRNACALVAENTQLNISRTKAIVGKDIFACETGLHVHGFAKDTSLFEAFSPESVGAQRKLGYGMKSGHAAIAHTAQKVKPAVQKKELANILSYVKRIAKVMGRPLTQKELENLVLTL